MGTFFDCHTHTEFSACAEDVTLQGYVEIAQKTPQQFAITDHSAQMFYPPENKWGFWSDDAIELFDANQDGGYKRIKHYIDTIRAAQCGGMLVGTELDVLPDGRKVFPDGLLESLDIVLGAVHSMPTVRNERPVDEIYAEFRMQVEAFGKHGSDVLAHPYRTLIAADIPITDELLDWTVQAALDWGFALEINSHKQFPEVDLQMTRLALEQGVPIAIGTDTHRTEQFGVFDYHEQILREAGLTPETWDAHLLEAPVIVPEAVAK